MFASVYRNFNDLSELEAELQRIRSEPVAGTGQLALDRDPSVPSTPSASIDLSPRGQRRGTEKTTDRPRSTHA
jgi:hypothetical protein